MQVGPLPSTTSGIVSLRTGNVTDTLPGKCITSGFHQSIGRTGKSFEKRKYIILVMKFNVISAIQFISIVPSVFNLNPLHKVGGNAPVIIPLI